MPTLIGFSGSRFGISKTQVAILRKICSKHPDAIGLHGDCKGGDAQFDQLCVELGMIRWAFPGYPGKQPADDSWRAYCKAQVIYEPKPFLARSHTIVDRCDFHVVCVSHLKPHGESYKSALYAQEQGKLFGVFDTAGRRFTIQNGRLKEEPNGFRY